MKSPETERAEREIREPLWSRLSQELSDMKTIRRALHHYDTGAPLSHSHSSPSLPCPTVTPRRTGNRTITTTTTTKNNPNTQNHKLFADKPVLLLSTSPGEKGGANNLELLARLLPWQGAKIVGQYSRGSYGQHFTDGKADAETQTALREALKPLLAQL